MIQLCTVSKKHTLNIEIQIGGSENVNIIKNGFLKSFCGHKNGHFVILKRSIHVELIKPELFCQVLLHGF